MPHPRVLIVMGSASDRPVMEESSRLLAEFGVPCGVAVASAHRTPDKVQRLARDAAAGGTKVIIAGAGYAAHLAGALASQTLLPVIGVPLEASPLSGLDALLSTVQMPAGVPVAAVAVGKTGARNAAILAVQILALSDEDLAKKLAEYRRGLAAKVEAADAELQH